MSDDPKDKPEPDEDELPAAEDESQAVDASKEKPEEEGGPEGPEPTRFGDWERKGRCFDF